MIIKYFMDSKGSYLGCWVCKENVENPIGIPEGAIEVSEPPVKAWYKWNRIEQRWPREDEVELTNEEKQSLYLQAAPIHEQLEALLDNENQRPQKLEALKAKLQEVKQSFPTVK
jgi:pyridoxine/pyridoxamine 5'-phosphate oxidase